MRNSVSIVGDTAEIVLPSKRRGNQVALIDTLDLPAARRVERWTLGQLGDSFYAQARVKVEHWRDPAWVRDIAQVPAAHIRQEILELQTVVSPVPRGFRLTFANGNTLDCRRANLILEPIATPTPAKRQANPWRAFSWISRVTSILDVLARLTVDDLTTGDVMAIFEVEHVAAIRAIRALGGYQRAGRLWIERASAIKALQAIARGGDHIREQSRLRRVGAEVTRAAAHIRARSIKIDLDRRQLDHVVALPAGLTLGPGALHVEFHTAQELMQRLMTFAAWAVENHAALSDYETEPSARLDHTSEARLTAAG